MATKKIVYVEDEPQMIRLVSRILEAQDITVIGAKEGDEGLQRINSELPDLILLDIMMPGMNGWEVYNHIKRSETTQDIPVIIITAKAFDMDEILGLHLAKVDGYITKPFRAHELLSKVSNLI